jgi:UDP-N-acetyl-D-glucosamine/UDP-N-acetyl-D-galactosamine dehydrogenase
MKKENYKICIVGLGYVGLPLAVAFAKKFQVVGFDINFSRIKELNKGNDLTFEINKNELTAVKKNILLTSKIQDIGKCNIYIITVPTPIDFSNKPDLKPLINASSAVGSILKKNDIVIFESTVYPGVTENVCVPELEKSSDLVFNKDFYCGYSPERINPGDTKRTVTKILKVTSGSTPEIAKKVDNLYQEIISAGTFMVSSIKIAEASKVIENIQRDVNIALVNELALIFNRMEIDTNEVIEAAATKWNFTKYTPGLVGGHCIGIDPYYLSFISEEMGYKPDLILAARQINNGMSDFIANQTIKEMLKSGKEVKGANILILGLTFKENCPDTRNTKVINIIEKFKDLSVNVDIFDPWVDLSKESEWDKHGIIDDPMKSNKKYEAIIVAVAHDHFKKYKANDYTKISNGIEVIIDIKNIVEKPTWRL